MVKSAAGSATYLAGLTDELLQYYVNLAKGGVELIYVENVAVTSLSRVMMVGLLAMLSLSSMASIRIWTMKSSPHSSFTRWTQEALDFGKKMVEECGKYGASLGYQLMGFGMGENEMTVEQAADFTIRWLSWIAPIFRGEKRVLSSLVLER